MPFHPECYQLFTQTLRWLIEGTVDGLADINVVNKDVLYAAMVKNHEEYEARLKLPYFELETSGAEQYWGCEPGEEVCECDS